MLLSHKKMRQAKGQHKVSVCGFTLVELLVVIVIFLVLVVFALPALKSVRESAARTQCLSNLREVGRGILSYTADNRGNFPPANSDSPLKEVVGWSGIWFYPSPVGRGLVPYLGGDQENIFRITVCPTNKFDGTSSINTRNHLGFPYVVNYNLMVARGAAKFRNIQSFTNHHAVVLMADGAEGATWNHGVGGLSSTTRLKDRHEGTMNILWADGRVSNGTKANEIKRENLEPPFL